VLTSTGTGIGTPTTGTGIGTPTTGTWLIPMIAAE